MKRKNATSQPQWLMWAENVTLSSPILLNIVAGVESSLKSLEKQSKKSAQREDQPPRYKIATITWLAIFPLALAINAVLHPMLNPLSPTLRLMLLTGIIVPLMTYLVMPKMTKWFSDWLYASEKDGKRRRPWLEEKRDFVDHLD